MTYKEFINNILQTRGRFIDSSEYHERHHIIPRCKNGTDDKDNLIDLFAREHFIAHKLLAEENMDDDQLVHAYMLMAFVKDGNQKRYELTAEEYEEARKIFFDAIKEFPEDFKEYAYEALKKGGLYLTALNAANEVIKNNVGRKSKKLWTENGTGSKIQFNQFLVCSIKYP